MIEQEQNELSNWLKSRLSPYFISVFTVWVVSNRVLIFGVFNFDDGLNLSQKIQFVHNQIESFPHFAWMSCYGIQSVYRSIIWALLCGFGVTILYEVLGTAGEVCYELIHRLRGWTLSKLSKKYIPKVEFERVQTQLKEATADLVSKREETVRNQNQYDIEKKRADQFEKQFNDADKRLDELGRENNGLKDKNNKYEKQANRFVITYASYGVEDNFIEVTQVVSNLFRSRKRFTARNEILGLDPKKYALKKLKIEYRYNNERKEVTANEYEELELKENQIEIFETEESQNMQKWASNQIKLAQVFNGDWELTISKDQKSEIELINIDSYGKYFVDGLHKFDLLVIELQESTIRLLKIDLKTREQYSQEKLKIVDDSLITGTDDLNSILSYKKLPSKRLGTI